LFSIEEVD